MVLRHKHESLSLGHPAAELRSDDVDPWYFFRCARRLSLGLTGGGGALFSVPLLVYGLGCDPQEAVGISLAAVGATAVIGLAGRLRAGQVEIRPGLLFAFGGMLGAPAGSWLARRLPETLLLLLFALLMLVIAIRIWRLAQPVDPLAPGAPEAEGPACRRDSKGELRLTSRCALLLSAVGVMTGVLSGLFGVGGGFIIVPALIVYSGMPIQRAVSTSLMIMTLVSITAVASRLLAGQTIDAGLTLLFVAGGIVGMRLGTTIGKRVSGPVLQKGFAVAIVGVALFVIVRELAG